MIGDDIPGHTYYTVGVQAWRFPWLRKFHVEHHFWSDDEKRVTLILRDGSALCFPRMDRKVFKVYPDYRTFKTIHGPDPRVDEDSGETLQ